MEHIPLQLRHRAHIGDALCLAKAFQRAQQIAERVAQLAILVRHAFEDLIADAVVFGEVDRQRPQADDVRAIGFHHLERVDGVAQRLGHFHALLVHRKAVGQHGLVGRMAARAAAFEQARLEPAAMLVTAFKVKVGERPCIAFRAHEIRPLARGEHEGMRRSAVEPDVQNVGHALIIVEGVVVAEIALCAVIGPGIDAQFLDARDDPRIDRWIIEILAGLAVHEQRDRHAPSALSAEHPVRAALDHRGDAVLALFRHPAGLGNGGHRLFAQRAAGHVLIHRHKPLRRAAIDDLGLGPPRMRIAVLIVRTRREQTTGLAQRGADRAVGRVELGVDDAAFAAEPGPVVTILAIAQHREHRLNAVRLAQVKIVLAMVRRHMDKAGAAVGRDEIAREQRARFGKEAAEMMHRVAGDGTGEVGTLKDFHRNYAEAGACGKLLDQPCGDNHRPFRDWLIVVTHAVPKAANCIFDIWAVGQCLVHRDGPRRRCPDDGSCTANRLKWAVDDLERHVDLRRGDVLIFYFGFGERGLLDG